MISNLNAKTTPKIVTQGRSQSSEWLSNPKSPIQSNAKDEDSRRNPLGNSRIQTNLKDGDSRKSALGVLSNPNDTKDENSNESFVENSRIQSNTKDGERRFEEKSSSSFSNPE